MSSTKRAAAGDDRRRHLRRHRRRGGRGLPRPRQRRPLHPLPEGPRVADPAAADDDLRRPATSTPSPSRARSTTARRSSKACSTTSRSATASRSPASTRSTGRASSRRSSTTSPRRWRSARRGAPVSFTVPTGNFGDVFAGYAAKRMGLPIDTLVIATNVQRHPGADARDRPLRTRGPSSPTASPSMDIQVSSNFERLLFEVHGPRRRGGARG